MLKLASFAMIAAMGSVGIAQACQTVSVGVGIPVVTIAPRVAYAPVVYRPYAVRYDHDDWRWHRDGWRRDHDRYFYEHGHRDWR